MGNGQLRRPLFDTGQARQPYLAAVGGLDVDLLQRLRPDVDGGRRLQHHPVLAGLGVDGGNLPLAEGVVQGVGDVADVDTQAAGGVAIDGQVHLQALVLQVAGDVGKFRALGQGVDQLAAPQAQQFGVG
ncbi:hypothetical protein D9M71_428810 [compost metagenome]